MEQNYIKIMVESLQKKVEVMKHIEKKNEEQTAILQEENTDWDAFDRNADEKIEQIDKLDQLDEGFEQLYQKVEAILQTPEGKTRYAGEIRRMQSLISQITEKSVSIQAVEARNKQLVEKRFAEAHKRHGDSRNSGRVAMDYYKNMQQSHVITPAFLDSKK